MVGWCISEDDTDYEAIQFINSGISNAGQALQLKVNRIGEPERIKSEVISGNAKASNTLWLRDGFQSSGDFCGFIEGGYFKLRHKFPFLQGRTYKGSIWLRAPSPITVEFLFRNGAGADYYNAVAVKRVTVNSSWSEVTIEGGFIKDVNGYLEINFITTGTLHIDNAQIAEITSTVLNRPVVSSNVVIPQSLFGLHMNKINETRVNDRPEIGFGLMRLWDSETRWLDIEPSDDNWFFTKMDTTVSVAQRGNPTVQILYTLGMTPRWAAQHPGVDGIYGKGSSSPPANIEEWKEYVRTVGERYIGRIKFYEIWNETDISGFWRGSIDQMIILTQAARQVLKAIDPEIKILSPNITQLGLPWLEEFIEKGGGQYVDIYSCHIYPTGMIENNVPEIEGIKSLLFSHISESNKPLWNTEGANGFQKGSLTYPTEKAAVARDYIVQWAQGIQNFSWYMWENQQQPETERTSPRLCIEDVGSVDWSSTTVTPTGIAYKVTKDWLVGTKMKSRYVNGNLWKIVLEKQTGETAWIVWVTTGSASITVPSGWGTTRIKRLDASSSNLSNPSISITSEPVLLEPNSNSGGRMSSFTEEAPDLGRQKEFRENTFDVYPNPFSDKVKIAYQLLEDSNINISLISLYGQKVSDIISSYQSKGSYETIFNSQDLPSGVYLFQFSSKDSKNILRTILIR